MIYFHGFILIVNSATHENDWRIILARKTAQPKMIFNFSYQTQNCNIVFQSVSLCISISLHPCNHSYTIDWICRFKITSILFSDPTCKPGDRGELSLVLVTITIKLQSISQEPPINQSASFSSVILWRIYMGEL